MQFLQDKLFRRTNHAISQPDHIIPYGRRINATLKAVVPIGVLRLHGSISTVPLRKKRTAKSSTSHPTNIHLVLQPSRKGVSFEKHRPPVSYPDELKSSIMHSASISRTSQHLIEDVKFKIVKNVNVFQAATTLHMSRQEVEQYVWAEATMFLIQSV